jgi:4-amino-4-deoxy-L-arabinose transferase-like glycosyltransferase
VSGAAPQPGISRPRQFTIALLVIAAGAFALRAWYALRIPGGVGGDSEYYHLQANLIADGHWFIEPFKFTYDGTVVPSAFHPPLWPFVLSILSQFGGRSADAHRMVGCLAGTGTVVVLGLVGRRLIGDRGGLVIAGLAAVYPNLWLNDGTLDATTLYGFLAALVLLGAYRWLQRPTYIAAAVLGAVIGLAALTRAEALLLVPLLLLPLALSRPGLSRRVRLVTLAVGAGALIAVLLPWTVLTASRFERPVIVSNNGGPLFAVTNCPSTYDADGPLVGMWDFFCNVPTRPHEDESEYAARAQSHGLNFARDHLGELPRVVATRIARGWDLYLPGRNVALAEVFRGRDVGIGRFGQYMYFATAVLAIGGAVVLRRRRVPLWPLFAMIALTTLTFAISWADATFRTAGELALIVLAGVFLTRLVYGPGALTTDPTLANLASELPPDDVVGQESDVAEVVAASGTAPTE